MHKHDGSNGSVSPAPAGSGAAAGGSRRAGAVDLGTLNGGGATARQPRPAHDVLVFLDALLGGATLVVDLHHTLGIPGQIRDQVADTGQCFVE